MFWHINHSGWEKTVFWFNILGFAPTEMAFKYPWCLLTNSFLCHKHYWKVSCSNITWTVTSFALVRYCNYLYDDKCAYLHHWKCLKSSPQDFIKWMQKRLLINRLLFPNLIIERQNEAQHASVFSLQLSVVILGIYL